MVAWQPGWRPMMFCAADPSNDGTNYTISGYFVDEPDLDLIQLGAPADYFGRDVTIRLAG